MPFHSTLITLEAPPKIGGVATYLSLARAAATEYQIAVDMAAPRGSVGATHSLPCDGSQNIFNLWAAAGAIKKLKSNCFIVAEAAALKAVLTILPWALHQRIRIVLHGSEVLELAHDSRFRRLLQHAENIYALSQFVARLVAEHFPFTAPKIIITGGAPSPYLTPIDGLKDPTRLLTVGRLHPRKGQSLIIEALRSGRLPGFSYDIVGPINKSKYATDLIASAKGLPVRFHGSLSDSDLSVVYSQCGLFVLPALALPNRVEGYGLALLDAMAMGSVPVGFDSGGVSEVVRHCRSGLLVPEGDTGALIDAIIQLSRDEALRAQMMMDGRAWAGEHSWRRVAQLLFT